MDIVVSHEGSDFDSLSSMYAVTRLYPGTVMVLGGAVNRNVRHFLTLYGHFFPYSLEKDLDWTAVKRVFVTDTSLPDRIGRAGQAIRQGSITYVVYDHHPLSEESLAGDTVHIEPLGACTTLLVKRIREKNLPLAPLEATLFTLGIYEDTGSFTFPTTTSDDLDAVSYLIQRGAQVGYVPRFTGLQLTTEQREILKRMIDSLVVENINGIPVHFTSVTSHEYIDGVSFLVHKLMDLEEIEVLFAVFTLEEKVYIISRSRLEDVDLRKILEKMNGGGHRGAASTALKNITPEEAIRKLRNILRESLSFLRAYEIMSYPVKTIHVESSIREASLIMIRFGYSGLPVVNEMGSVVGLIARRDVEKAIHHGLQNAPVKSFMAPQVITVTPDSSIFQVRNLMVEKDIGRIPVVKEGRLMGIITRSDLLRTFHQQENFLSPRLTRLNISQKLFFQFSEADLSFLNKLGDLARKMGYQAYLVGGVVRDCILGIPNEDLDIVIEGNAIEFVKKVTELFPGKTVSYPPFGTAILIMANQRRIDFATARQEYYPQAGSAPEVEYASLRRDLFRRDFTINALAASLSPDNWGDLFDFFGGIRDLENHSLRILHPLSLVEDPARIIRAVRFEQKYDFAIEPFTMSLLKQAVREEQLNSLKPDRLKEEIQLILRLPGYHRYLRRLYQLDTFPCIFPGCTWKAEYTRIFEDLKKGIDQFPPPVPLDLFLLKLSPLLENMSLYHLDNFVKKLSLSHRQAQAINSYFGDRDRLRRTLSRPIMRPSAAFRILQRIPLEFLYLNLAIYSDNQLAYQTLERYLTEWFSTKPVLTGNDLKEMGLREGPIYATILEELRLAMIDGMVFNRAEERQFVKNIVEGMR
ncbi:MAG TPA: CBS domain-containing protein [Atribacteraceae bacterium]|nr:CBS domain-containing protein [Atribacteraceae bacterium]